MKAALTNFVVTVFMAFSLVGLVWFIPATVFANEEITGEDVAGDIRFQVAEQAADLHQHRSGDDGDHAHQLDQNVERGAGGILEWISNRITHNGSFVRIGSFVISLTIDFNPFFKHFLCVIPGTSCIRLENSH